MSGHIPRAEAEPDFNGFELGYLTAAAQSVGKEISDLHPASLEAMMGDCAEARADRRCGWREDSSVAGHQFWNSRQEDFRSWGDAWTYQMRNRFPPITLSIDDAGKVCQRTA
jgi:hypothetical protein